MTLTLRAAGPSDVSALAAIDSATTNKPRKAAQWAALCGGDPGLEWLLVAESDTAVVGYAAVALVLDEASIHAIAIAPAERGQGFGSQLLRGVLAELRERGARRCLLEVRESNLAARALYNRHGFTEDGVRRDYYPCEQGREDALLLSRRL
jgi:ribosomal-protein-alanine N-acetyltransferase